MGSNEATYNVHLANANDVAAFVMTLVLGEEQAPAGGAVAVWCGSRLVALAKEGGVILY